MLPGQGVLTNKAQRKEGYGEKLDIILVLRISGLRRYIADLCTYSRCDNSPWRSLVRTAKVRKSLKRGKTYSRRVQRT
jgi:hypothetical protein